MSLALPKSKSRLGSRKGAQVFGWALKGSGGWKGNAKSRDGDWTMKRQGDITLVLSGPRKKVTSSPANSTHDFENTFCTDPNNHSLFGPTALNEEVSHFEKRKVFILVSTVMTWARSKPLDPVSTLACPLCNISPSVIFVHREVSTVDCVCLHS